MTALLRLPGGESTGVAVRDVRAVPALTAGPACIKLTSAGRGDAEWEGVTCQTGRRCPVWALPAEEVGLRAARVPVKFFVRGGEIFSLFWRFLLIVFG